MAAEGATQALVAAFFFGIVLNAASAALVLYLRDHGLASVFRDSQRLVLILFLLSAALWAQIDFITILLDVSKSRTPCQIGTIFSTVFDQFARFSIEQFLLWGLNNSNGGKLPVMQLIPQVLALARFLAGAVFTGFTRPQTDTFCVATTSAPPVGILVTALDGVIVLLLIARAYLAGRVAKDNRGGKGIDADRARALMSVVLGLVFWTGTSVPLFLGVRSWALATRTALPAGGLLALIVSVAGGAGALLAARTTNSRPPEAPSPRRINISRDISTSDTDYPPSRFEDLKEAAIRSSTTFINPREPPRVKDETSLGFPFGAIQGEAMTPLQAVAAPVSNVGWKVNRSASQKRGLIGFTKGKLAISHPILQENAGQNPLDKIPVMDLQAAAIMDKERRARMQEDASIPVSRTAGPLMGMAPEEVLQRGLSLKRKEVAPFSRESVFPGALEPEAVALTTSAQLSPGGEETRRRSPRPSLQEEQIQTRQLSPEQAAEPVKLWSEPSQERPLTTLQPLLKGNIRPSRTLPPSPKAPPPELTKTPLQRRPTIGLPSNPRARGLEIAEEPGSQHRTILFVNNIEYNDPVAVEAIIKGASKSAAKPAPVAGTPGTGGSVVNRPRPIPRKPADSPAQSSPAMNHRRTKSGGSLVGRKSLLTSSAGSPTRLPPLPVLPRSATVAGRPHPNETRSMTFEEKVTLLFPSPPSGNAGKRRSSVPEVPRIPASYLDIDSSPSELSDYRRSNRTTKTSVRTESVLEVDEIPRLPGKVVLDTTGAAGSQWLRAFGDGQDDGKLRDEAATVQAVGKRKSSPVIPLVPRVSAWTETTYDRSEDEGTNWSPMGSPELAVTVPIMQRLGLPQSVAPSGSELSFADNRSRETLPIMLDTSTMQQADLQESSVSEVEAVATPELPTWHRRVGDECPTFSDRKVKTKSRKMTPPAPLSLNTTSTKKLLAIQVEPSPLESPGQAIRQIQAQLKKLEEVDRASPQSASRRLALLEDLEREMGQQAEHWQEIKHDMGRDSMSSMQTTSPAGRDSRRESAVSDVNTARNSIRQSIGAERRASRVARLQHNGSLRIPDATVRNSASPKLSKWQKRLTEAQMDYMDAQLLRGSNVNFLQLSRAQLASPTPPDSDDSEDEVPPVPSLPGKVMVEQAPKADSKHPSLWTLAPKESSSHAGLLWTPILKPSREVEPPLPGLSVRPAQRKEWAPLQIESSHLWRKPYNTANRASGLWRPVWASAAPPAEPVTRPASKATPQSQKPPRPVTQRPPRRNKRVTLLPDILENPEPLPDKRGTLGIFQFPWGEKSDTARIQPRPSMYMAMPGTMTSGGPSFGLATDARSKQLEPAEYSSSFFDDYDDDEDDIEGLDSDEEEDSDDGFDETTLWEIASLLKTDAVPSKDSLLPPPSGSVLDDYEDELTSDEEVGPSREQSIVIGLAEPRELILEQKHDSATIESSTLQLLEVAVESELPPKPAAGIGLPAKPKPAPASQVSRAASAPAAEAPPAPEMARSPGHTAEVPRGETAPQQGSAKLWYPPSPAGKPSAEGGLWVPGSSRPESRGTSEEPAAIYMSRKPRPVEKEPLDKLISTRLWASEQAVKKSQRNWILGTTTGHLWTPPSQADKTSSLGGLFTPEPRRPSYRGTSEEPAAKYMCRRPRPTEQQPLDKLTSTELWAFKSAVKEHQRNWILGVKTKHLWSPPSQATKPSLRGGLFSPGLRRSDLRTTSEEPAARHISRRPRPVEQKPLDNLTSTKLWVSTSAVREDQPNWILGIKKPGNHLWSLPSQASNPPSRGGLFVPGSSIPRYRGTSEEPAAKHISRKTRPAEQRPLDTLTSTTLWAPANAPKSQRNWILGTKTRPSGSRIQRPHASYKDWQSALNEALAASYPHTTKKLNRFTATPAQWKAALDEAISLSARRRAPAFNSAVRHPVFAANSLVTRSEWFHPAATGYTSSASPLQVTHEVAEQQQQEGEKEEEQILPDSAIQAQIEALEQERLFVERLAQEEYRRRTSSMATAVAPAEPAAVDSLVMPMGAAVTVQDLQRRLSRQIRQSLVFTAGGGKSEPSLVAVETKFESKSRGNINSPVAMGQVKLSPLLWTPPTHSEPVPSTAGLWPATTSSSTIACSRTAEGEEDKLAATQRARRRRVVQKQQRRQEILAQIAAVESGLNPFVDFGGMGLWVYGDGSSKRIGERERGLRKDWLHSVCVRRTRGVVLRY